MVQSKDDRMQEEEKERGKNQRRKQRKETDAKNQKTAQSENEKPKIAQLLMKNEIGAQINLIWRRE